MYKNINEIEFILQRSNDLSLLSRIWSVPSVNSWSRQSKRAWLHTHSSPTPPPRKMDKNRSNPPPPQMSERSTSWLSTNPKASLYLCTDQQTSYLPNHNIASHNPAHWTYQLVSWIRSIKCTTTVPHPNYGPGFFKWQSLNNTEDTQKKLEKLELDSFHGQNNLSQTPSCSLRYVFKISH